MSEGPQIFGIPKETTKLKQNNYFFVTLAIKMQIMRSQPFITAETIFYELDLEVDLLYKYISWDNSNHIFVATY